MKLETQLFDECISRNYNCSITYQRINDYSVEIYRGYQSNYEKIFYTDGHIDREKAIRKALKFLNDINLIDTSTSEGKLLLAAVAKITTESQTDKTPNEVMKQLTELSAKMK